MKQQQEIIESTFQFIQNQLSSEDDFNEHALQLFSYQYQHNLPYRTFCMQKGKRQEWSKRGGIFRQCRLMLLKKLH
ncbi:hypothetical protein AAAC51_36090 [Priestia megaterium]